MRIQIHDFGGYPFVADLTNRLVGQGHQVDHVYSAQYSGNVGSFADGGGRREGLTVTGLRAAVEPDKYGVTGRLRFELAYARAWSLHADRSRPDVVVHANVPLVALARMARWTRKRGVPWVLWHQDLVSLAMGDELRRRFPAPVAKVGAVTLSRMERLLALRAAGIVAIGPAFADVYERWGLGASRYEIVPNWAPLDEMAPEQRINPWSDAHLRDRGLPRLVYAGTLGRKHRPSLLLDLAKRLAVQGCPVELVVVSEGPAVDELALRSAEAAPSLATILPFQPAQDLPMVLGAGDVLVVLLEPEAAAFSVPSKVLTYLAAGRPVLGLMPESNAAASVIRQSGGFVADPSPGGVSAAADWAQEVLSAPGEVAEMSSRARQFAETELGSAPALDVLVAVIERASAR